MKSLQLIATAALLATTMAAPAAARSYCDTHRCYHHYHRGPVGAAADVAEGAVGAAAGIAGAAIGTAGAIATAPFRPTNSYAYYPNQGFVCQPGTWFRGEDGRMHPCQ